MDERTSLRILVVCAALAAFAPVPTARGGPVEGGSVQDLVPRSYQVSVGRDHVFASVRFQVRPVDVGEADWSKWDRNGDGSLDDPEARVLGAQLRDRELEYVCIAIDGEVLPLGRMAASRVEPVEAPIPLDATIRFRVEGRSNLVLEAGEHRFVLYDRPRTEDGVVPMRLSLVTAMELVSAVGARAETRGNRRLEAVVSRAVPGIWGTFVRK